MCSKAALIPKIKVETSTSLYKILRPLSDILFIINKLLLLTTNKAIIGGYKYI